MTMQLSRGSAWPRTQCISLKNTRSIGAAGRMPCSAFRPSGRISDVTNCIVVALGIAQAMLAPTLSLAVLGYAGLEFINGLFMHVVPFIRTKGRFSPGLITSVLFFLPLSIATFWTALAWALPAWVTSRSDSSLAR